MKVRLTHKFATVIDGIDLSAFQQGDEIDLSPREAEMLVAEGWAAPVLKGARSDRDRAHDRPRPKRESHNPPRPTRELHIP